MASALENEDQTSATFYIGHHETRRQWPVTDDLLRVAQEDCNYDMLTAPITTDSFHSRVLSALSPYLDSPADALASHSGLCPPKLSSLTPAETTIAPGDNISQLILVTSPWIDLASADPLIADVSRQVLSLEVQYAAFCGANNVIISGPRKFCGRYQPDCLSQYARAVQQTLKLGHFIQVHVLLPMTGEGDSQQETSVGDLDRFARQSFKSHMISGSGPSEDLFDTWDVWHTTRTVCKYNTRLSVALTVSRHIPPISLQSRWYSEPVRLLHIPGSSFYQNKYGETSLSQQQKLLVIQYMRLRNQPWIILSDVGPLTDLYHPMKSSGLPEDLSPMSPIVGHSKCPLSDTNPTPAESSKHPSMAIQKRNRIGSHLRYMRQLQHKLPHLSAIERFGAGYQDYLQNPLQPLSDNLESITYEVFEKDPVKYDWYERAMVLALQQWQAQSNPASGLDGRVVVAVVGAGRGPLVNRALQASATSGVKIDLWAVEKNQNAFVLLQRQNIEKWNQRVNLVQSDMRTWTGPFFYTDSSLSAQSSQTPPNAIHFHVDILVSELLGSFGDNELSPECIDGVQRLLNPSHGISIPSSYTAHLTPIASPRLHADILSRIASGDSNASQVPYVVMLQAIDILSTTLPESRKMQGRDNTDPIIHAQSSPIVLEAWEFSHPIQATPLCETATRILPGSNEHNRRFARLNFQCRDRGACHGLGGYFEAILYEQGKEKSSTGLSSSDNGISAAQIDSRAEIEKKVELSTNPLNSDQKSKDMISWFPIFFPLKVPLYFPDNSLLSVSIWRQTDGKMVWYEWMIESFMLLDVAADGRQKVERLGSTDLHSSFSNACLL